MRASSVALTRTVAIYFKVTKPNVWWLLAFIGVVGYSIGTGGRMGMLETLYVTSMLIAGSAGAETVANYYEREIDSLMKRTMNRPLPKGLITPPWKALVLGVTLIAISLLLAWTINLATLAFMAFGIFDYLVIYIVLTKKRTPLNVLLGSFAGGAPVMAGYVSATGVPTVEAWLLSALVVLWIPSHVWSLALKYKEDYARAGIPMLPVVVDERKAIRCISSTALLLVVFSLLLYWIAPFHYGPIYLGVAAVAGTVLLYLSSKLMLRPNFAEAWRLFKFTSPYLAMLFGSMMLESIL